MASDFRTDKLYSILEAFRPFLRSIDVRTIAVIPEHGEEWENVVTSIFVSERSVDEIRREQSKLPKLRNNQVALFLSALPFDYSVFGGFAEGNIGPKWGVVRGVFYTSVSRHIKVRQFDPLELKICSEQRRVGGLIKYVLSATDLGLEQERQQLWVTVHKQDNEAKRLNYSNMMELIRDTLQIEIGHYDRKDFEITVTNPAQIDCINFKNSTFDVKIARLSGLRDLQLNVVLKRATKGGFFDPFCRETIPIDEIAASPFNLTLRPPTLFPYDLIELKLLHSPSALTLDEKYERVPLRNVVEPFFKVLAAFCPIEEFKKMLLEPQNCGKEPEVRFENAVAYLLWLDSTQSI